MVRPGRFEHPTYGFVVRRSVQLSYERTEEFGFILRPRTCQALFFIFFQSRFQHHKKSFISGRKESWSRMFFSYRAYMVSSQAGNVRPLRPIAYLPLDKQSLIAGICFDYQSIFHARPTTTAPTAFPAWSLVTSYNAMPDNYTKTLSVSEPESSSRLHDLDVGIVPLPKGHVLGSYKIRGLLGIGGFGITYRALDLNLNSMVALKEYLPVEFAVRKKGLMVEARSPMLRDAFAWGKGCFLNEARTLAQFKHPNIVRVLSFFEANNSAYFAMDFEKGQNLKRILQSRESLEEEQIYEVLLPLMEGLELLHAKGFIHRDVKPGNIYVREDGTPVLLDFGAAMRPEDTLSELGRTLLTPGYAPPEQYDGKATLGPWTDIYGLAAVTYRAVSGVKPVESILRKAALLLNKPDPLPRAAIAGQGRYSRELLQAIDLGLRVDAGQRPQSVNAWRALFYSETTAPQKDAAPSNLAQEMRLFTGASYSAFNKALLAGKDPEHIRVDSVLLQTLLSLRVTCLARGVDAIAAMQRQSFDIIFCDSALADMPLMDFLGESSRKLLWNRPPVIVLHEKHADAQLLAEGILLGAAAFIQRPYVEEDLQRALRQLAQLQQTYAVEESLLTEASRLIAQGRLARAMQFYADVLSIEEEAHSLGEPDFTALSWRGMRHIASGEYVPALECFHKAAAMLRLLAEAQSSLADAHRKMGNMELYLEAATLAAKQAERHIRMLERRMAFAALMRQDDNAKSTLNDLGVELRRKNDYRGALNAFTQALHLAPRSAGIYYNLARTQAHLRKFKAARASLENALRLQPHFPQAVELYNRLAQKKQQE